MAKPSRLYYNGWARREDIRARLGTRTRWKGVCGNALGIEKNARRRSDARLLDRLEKHCGH